MIEWIQANGTIIGWLAQLSLVSFVASLIAVPLLVLGIPPDYFACRNRGTTPWADKHPAVRLTLSAAKNGLGIVLIGFGVVMLVLPGQGILTILIGLMLSDFPGKYRLERWLVERRSVVRAISWLRFRAGRAPLVFDREEN